MKFANTSGRSKSTSFSKDQTPNKVSSFQARLADEGEQILSSKLGAKIDELDELCTNQELWGLSRIEEIRQETEDNLEKYLAECEALEEDGAGGAGNPLMQLLMGGAAPAEEKKGAVLSENPDDEEDSFGSASKSKSASKLAKSLSAESISKAQTARNPTKLLLDSIALSENNKINLKLSLELENKDDQPPAKKSKKENQNDNNSKKIETTIVTRQNSKKATEEEKEQTNEAKQSESDEAKEEEEELDNEEKEEKPKNPILSAHSKIVELISILKPQLLTIIDWCVVLRAWLLATMPRNKNLGGADLAAECRAVIIEEVKGVEDEFSAYKEQLSAYFLTRATIMEKYVKAPEFEDLKNFIVEQDEATFLSCRSIMMALRNQTMNLYDAIEKDSERLFGQEEDSRSMNTFMY